MPPEDDPKNDEPIDREEWEAAMAESVSGEPPRAEPPACHETHYYCVNHTCDWVGHAKTYERRCPRCGAMVWKEGTDSEFKGKPSPSCLPRAGSRPSAPAPSGEPQSPAISILAKCEQYWNEPNICDAEIHAVLEFIHAEARKLTESSPVDLQDAAKLKAQEEILREMAEYLWRQYGTSRHCTANEAREDLIKKADEIAAAVREGR